MTAAKYIPMRDFFKNPVESDHEVSPDGKYISFLASYERRMNVFVKTPGGAPARVTSETERDIAAYFWKGERILYAKDFGGDENFHVVSVDLQGGDLKDLTPGEKVQAHIVDALIDDDQHLIVAHNRRDAEVFDVFRIDVTTGREELIAQNPGNITVWMTNWFKARCPVMKLHLPRLTKTRTNISSSLRATERRARYISSTKRRAGWISSPTRLRGCRRANLSR